MDLGKEGGKEGGRRSIGGGGILSKDNDIPEHILLAYR
jgi:hypothetical protein